MVVNEHGDVRVVAAPAGELLGIRGAASAARIEASSAAGGTVLTVRPLAPLEAGFAADIEVRVPAGVGLSVRTGAGAVTVAGVAALAGREAGDAVLDIETASGEVVFWVDPASDVAVEVATSGELAVDYSVTVELRHHQEPAKHARVVLGEGGPRWRATSRLGKVSVLRADRGHREPE